MAVKDKSDVIKADYQAQLDKVEELKSSLSQKIQLVDDMMAEHDAEVAQAKADGFADGKASIQLPDASDPAAQYTQEQMSAAVNAGQDQVRAEMQPQLDQANSDKAALQSQLDSAKADLDAAKQAQADAESKLAADDAKIALAAKDLA
jgi:chromosome segregation ATPase